MKKKLMILFAMLPFVLLINGCLNGAPSFEIVVAQDTVEINSEYTDYGAQYKSGSRTKIVYSADVVETSVLGLHELYYEFSYDSISFSAIRYVIVVDQMEPDIELNLGVDTVTAGSTWVDQGVTVVDNSLEEITAVALGTVNTQIAGTYEIEYIATDSSGNVNSISRFVTVINNN